MAKLTREKQVEIAFVVITSVLVVIIFYGLISSNGVVLGNDPSVHLQKAQLFLQTGKIPLVNLGWTPPLYEILLAMLIAFSGAVGIGQMIFLVKALAVLVDWLLFLSVYLVASKIFSKKVGATAAVLLFLCFPMYEANAFGGYTTILGIVFLLLVLLYLPLAIEKLGYVMVTFLAAFALFLSHQLAAFLAVIILVPVLLYMLIKLRGAYLKVTVALILGGGIAFFLYYFQAVAGYIGEVFYYVFFGVKSYAYQIPSASFASFMVDFGFIFFFALAGIIVSFAVLRPKKKLIFYSLLILSFLVPLFFAESYLFGFYMPFQWFIYYLIAPMAILAAVSLVFAADQFLAFYAKNQRRIRRIGLMAASVCIVVLLSTMVVYRSNIVYGKTSETSVYYSTTDPKALDAGVWLEQNYPNGGTVVDTEVPGSWFADFSQKTVFAQTDPTVERNAIAESVLGLSYDILDPQNLLRTYEDMGDISDESYVSFNQVWQDVSSSNMTINYLEYTVNGTQYQLPLSSFNRQIIFNEQSSPAQIEQQYSNEYVMLTETTIVPNNALPVNIEWAITPLQNSISNVTLYVSYNFDLYFRFDAVQAPQVMNWVNPWNVTTKHAYENEWCYVVLTGSQLQDSYIGLYDQTNQAAYAFKFSTAPDWTNIGALADQQIDAIRFQYQFDQINANQTATRQYQVLMLTRSSFPSLQQSNLESLFNYQPTEFTVSSGDYKDYIAKNNIEFIVYDKSDVNPSLLHCDFLQLIYSNEKYDIFKILSNYTSS